MGTIENPDLPASATRIVCLKHFASIVALRKNPGLDQPKGYPAPKPRFLVYKPVLMKLLAIRLGYQPKNFWPGTRKTIAKSLVMSRVEGSALCAAAYIFFGPPPRSLFAFLLARVAYDSAQAASIPQYQPRIRLVGLGCKRKPDAACPPVVSGHGGTVFLRGASGHTLNFRGSI